MQRNLKRFVRCLPAAIVIFLAVMIPVRTLLPKDQPKTYPEEGKIVGSGTTARAVAAGNTTRTVFTHTYKVATDTKIFELDCNKVPFITSTGGECGGDKKLAIGDSIHFRIQKSWAYIPITDSGQPAEQKLRILSEELNPDAKAADKPQTTDDKTDAKPPDGKN